MSLGVRFKFYLAIWASLQVISSTHGLKMQVKNLSSSPKPLSESNLNFNAIGSSQIVNSAKVLPNVPIKRLDSLSSPTNTFEPSINVPNSLSTPSLKFENVPRSWDHFGRTLNPQENVIDAVLVETIPYNNGIKNVHSELSGLNQPENIPDLVPSENNIVPSTNFANMFGKNTNNLIMKPSFGTAFNSHTNVQNVNPTIEIIQPTNTIKELNYNAPDMHNFHRTLPSLNTFVPDIPVAENEVLTTNNDRNVIKNIPKMHKSFGPIFNPNLHILETVGAENKITQPISNSNIFNSFSNELNNYQGIPNFHVIDPITTKPHTPAVESDAIPRITKPVSNTIPKSFDNCENNPNAQIIITSPEHFQNQQHNAYSLNNAIINYQNIATGNLNNEFNNVNQINVLQNQNQFGRVLSPQFNPPLELSNLNAENYVTPVNTLNNKVMTQNLQQPLEPLQINNINRLNSKINEIAAPPNNMNHFYNIQRLPNINFNEQTFRKDSTVTLTDNNNNFVIEVPNDISNKIEKNELGMFDQRYLVPMSNRVPFKSNTDLKSEITVHNPVNNVKGIQYPELSLSNQNNKMLSVVEAPVTTLASRNPFSNWYKPPGNTINNPSTYDKSNIMSAQNEIEAISQSHHSLNKVEIQSPLSNQIVGNLFGLPKIQAENPSYLVSQAQTADAQVNIKPGNLPSFTPKITSVFHNLASTNHPSPETDNAKIPFIYPQVPSSIFTSSHLNFPKAELPSVSVTSEFNVDNNCDIRNTNFNNVMKYEQMLPIDLGHIPKTNLPSVSRTPEFKIGRNSFVNPYLNSEIISQTLSSESEVEQLPISNFGLLPSNTLTNSQLEHFSFPQSQSHSSPISMPQSNFVNPNNAVSLQQILPQVELANLPLSNIGSPPLSVLQQMAPNVDPCSSIAEISTPQVVSSNFHNNINPQIVLNAGQPSTLLAAQPSQDFISNVQTIPSNIVNTSRNNFGSFTQEQFLHSNYKIPTVAPSSTQVFDTINNVQTVTPTPINGFTPYISPFNSVFNAHQSVPSYSNNVVEKIGTIDPSTPQDNSVTPFYHSEPQRVLPENPYSLSSSSVVPYASITNMNPTQPNTIPYSTPYYPSGITKEIENSLPLYISPSVKEHTTQLNIPSNAQQFASIPEVTTFNDLNSHLSPRVAITQELPFIPQKSFNQHSNQGYLSSVSHLPNVYTANAIQQLVKPTVSYTNVTPNNQFAQVSELFPTRGIVNSVNDAASIVAKNVLTNFISKKLNAKIPQYSPVTNLPPVNPYVPTSFYSTPPPITYDPVIPFISTLPAPNENSYQYPTTSHSYEVFEIPDYYIDDYITDLSTTSLFADIPEIPDIPDMDYDFENDMTQFIPYMSSLKVNILPIIEDVNLEPVLPSNILIDAYPNMSPTFLLNTNIPYPVGPQVVDIPGLQSLKGKKCRDVKDLERLISLFVLSELINGNENNDWDGLEKIIALLCVT